MRFFFFARVFCHSTEKPIYVCFGVFFVLSWLPTLFFSPVRLVVVSLSRSNVSLASKITSGEILKLPTRNAAAASVWNAENSSAYREAAPGQKGWFWSCLSRSDCCCAVVAGGGGGNGASAPAEMTQNNPVWSP